TTTCWSAGSRRLGASRAVAQQPLLFAVPVAQLLGFPLVVLLLAAREADLDLDPALNEMQIERRHRVAGALDLADQAIDLATMQQQLAGPRRVGLDVRRCSRQRRHMRAEQNDLAALDDDVGFLQLCAPGADRLDLPALQREARLEFLLDEIVVIGFFVFYDAHTDVLVTPSFVL